MHSWVKETVSIKNAIFMKYFHRFNAADHRLEYMYPRVSLKGYPFTHYKGHVTYTLRYFINERAMANVSASMRTSVHISQI